MSGRTPSDTARDATGSRDPAPARPRRSALDPTGKRALFETPVVAAPDTLRPGGDRIGRAALFSTGEHVPGTVVVECSGCDSRTRISLGDLLVRLASFSMYLPLLRREHPHRMRCPGCDRTAWCRIGWGE